MQSLEIEKNDCESCSYHPPTAVLPISSCGSSCGDGGKQASLLPLSTCGDGGKCVRIEHLYSASPAPIPIDTPESTFLDIARKLSAEALGTGLLIIIVVGSGIMAETLSPTDVGLQLLQNAIATCGGLMGLILMFGPVSGAHFNPIVSMVDYLHGDMPAQDLLLYTIAQIIGGIIGSIIANLEFNKEICISEKERSDWNLWIGEIIGTITLLLVIHGCVRTGQKTYVPFAVAAWVCGGYFFTSSTIFANPAVTIARMFTNTFAGIEPRSAGIFIGFQILGGLIAFPLIKFFYPQNLSMRRDDNLYLRVCIQGNYPKNLDLDV
jgi:glycerol uptake facilitator-like aquaporin